jgi:hypothetical protein
MPLTSPRFRDNMRLQQASRNAPSMKWGERGEPVAIVQQAFIDLGFPMPKSTLSGKPDGAFGQETYNVAWAFQKKHQLSVDGAVGKQTMEKLDQLLQNAPSSAPTSSNSVPYAVPGVKTVVAQPSSMSCWATVYCMMRSWKMQRSFEIRESVAAVGAKWAEKYDKSYPPTNQGMPSTEFGAFLQDARMQHQPMGNLTIDDWATLLRTHGLLWIGASVNMQPHTGLHSRILEAIIGTGQPESTRMQIIDPAGGKRYTEPFMAFLAKYEAGIMSVSGEYFQVRHF